MNEKGQGLVEYLLLVCLIAVSSIAIVKVVGTNIEESYANISQRLRGEKPIRLTSPNASAYRTHELGDYGE